MIEYKCPTCGTKQVLFPIVYTCDLCGKETDRHSAEAFVSATGFTIVSCKTCMEDKLERK